MKKRNLLPESARKNVSPEQNALYAAALKKMVDCKTVWTLDNANEAEYHRFYQTVAELFPNKKVYAICDTFPLPGFQGVTAQEVDCDRCGQCYLNITGGICPITACSKSLVNGQCGGAKNGKCEVDCNMDCGWERIYRRLKQLDRLDVLKCPVQIRNYNKE